MYRHPTGEMAKGYPVRLGLVVAAVVLALGARAGAADTYWKGAEGSELPWGVVANWTAGLPTNVQNSYSLSSIGWITNGGTARIGLSGPSETVTAYYIYLGNGSKAGTINQTNGTMSLNYLCLSAGDSFAARYTLSGGTLLGGGGQVGGAGTNVFSQTGGAAWFTGRPVGGEPAVGSNLQIGRGADGTDRAGRYELGGSGTLRTSLLRVGSLGLVDQTSGSTTAEFLNLQGTYRLAGGSLTVHRGWRQTGTLDFDGASASLAIGNAIVDLSQATITGGSQVGFSTGARSLVIVPTGFDTSVFGAGWNPGNLVHTAGSTLNIGPGRSVEGWGVINDHTVVTGNGSFEASTLTDGTNKGLYLTRGLYIADTGSVNLRGGAGSAYASDPANISFGGTLNVQNHVSGMSGGSLKVYDQIVGSTQSGTFVQTGGTNNMVNDLYISRMPGTTNASAEGRYELGGTGVLETSNLSIGFGGKGSFIQTGGTATVRRFIHLGQGLGCESLLELSGGTLNTGAAWVASNTNTKATVNHSGGTWNVDDFLLLAHLRNASEAAYSLSGTALLNVSGHEIVGREGQATFIQTGGTNTMTSYLSVSGATGREARYDLSGGVLNVNTDTGKWSNGHFSVGGKGTSLFNHTGGTATVTHLRVATPGDGTDSFQSGLSGIYNLGDTGQLVAASESIGRWGLGYFTQTGGTNTVAGTVSVGTKAQGTGTYALSGAASQLSAAELIVGDAGKGTFIHSSGSALMAGGVVVGKSASGDGAYQYSSTGNELSTPRLVVGDAGKGAFTQNSGTISISEGITLGYGGTGIGTYTIGGGTLSTANLIIGRDSGNSHGTGSFIVNNAASLVTVSSSLHIGLNGSLQAVEGTVIHMTGSHFSNASINPAAVAGMSNLTLIFEGGPSQLDTFEVAGRDFGIDILGLEENFALHTLSIGGSQIGKLRLVDLVDNQPNWTGTEALYVEHLIMTQGSMLELGKLNLYYGTLTDQGGMVLSNGGSLQEIPEPATFGLLATGLAVLINRRRRTKLA